eukprot:IDg19815t1
MKLRALLVFLFCGVGTTAAAMPSIHAIIGRSTTTFDHAAMFSFVWYDRTHARTICAIVADRRASLLGNRSRYITLMESSLRALILGENAQSELSRGVLQVDETSMS